MRLVLLAVLLASLAGCEYRYEAVTTDKDCWILDKKTGQVLKAERWGTLRIPLAPYSGEFGPKPKYK